MLTIKNIRTISGETIDCKVESPLDTLLDGSGLTLLPALIDPHVHLRVPGAEHKENWETGAKAAIAGGITTVFDMPNNTPACITKKLLLQKKHLIDAQLQNVGIPLRYGLYLGADKHHFGEILRSKEEIVGIKIFMGSSTGDLVMDDDDALREAFYIAAEHDLIVAVHAEDEHILERRKEQFADVETPDVHSKIRDREAAIVATRKALEIAEHYDTRLYILHVSTREELELIRQAKKRGVSVAAEATPHHLFLNEEAYAQWGTKVQMNPPLRTADDQKALWEAIHDGTIDTIGSDHAPHTLDEKQLPYGKSPSGIPGLETLLPLLLNAYHEKKLSLEQIVALTRTNVERLFRLKSHEDFVLVDLQKTKELLDCDLKTKCGWSPFTGRILKGWPVYTILRGQVYSASNSRSYP